MRVGEAYLVHLGDWHTFVGRVTEQVAPGIYEMTACSKISDTNNGDVWHELAAGDQSLRNRATYLHCKTPVMVPLTIAAIQWTGKTPQEEGL